MDVTRQGLPTLNHLLQHTLRRLCTESQWVYAVFWRILPRNYPPPQWDTEGGMMDRSKGNKRNWILVWEDGFCNFSACAAGAVKDTRGGPPFFHGAQQSSAPQRGTSSDDESEAMSPELFFKMSHEVYNYGEGLMGKVAADSSHKWVYREPVEHEISFLSSWQGSLDPHPRTWEAQFKSGIQTIAVVAVQEGVLQLGSTKKIMEDLNFVLHMQRRFNYLQSIPGVFVPHPMSCAGKRRDGSSPPADRGHWISAPDASTPHLTARSIDQFLSPRLGPHLWRSSSDTSVLGVKRPPDSEPLSLSFNSFNSFLNDGGSAFHHRPECPSPPKSLHTGHTSPQGGAASPTMPPNLLPSMSSLQALLSKLPSVTPIDRETSTSFDAAAAFVSNNRPPVSRPIVKVPFDRPLGAMSAVATKTESEPLRGTIGVMAAATSSSPSSGNSDVASAEHTSDDTEGGTSQCKDSSQKFSSFLDTFDNLADFGTLQDSLGENGDSYSFLSEIYS